jgi:hypothetical protein
MMTMMGTPLEHCNFFPSYLFFLRSAASNAGLRTPFIAIEIGPSVGHAFLPVSEGEE